MLARPHANKVLSRCLSAVIRLVLESIQTDTHLCKSGTNLTASINTLTVQFNPMNISKNTQNSVSHRGTPQTENHPQTATPVKTLHIPVYAFDDLDDDAKEKARNWWRDGALDHDWWDSIYADAETIGLRIKSFDLDRNRHATGEFTQDALSVCEAIIANHGENCETYKTAMEYKGAFRNEQDSDEYEAARDEFLKALLEDYSIILQHEYEYQLSDQNADEIIRANKYTFTAEGKREG